MENLKKYKFSFILLILFLLLSIFYISLPSKNKISEVEVKTIQKSTRTMDVQAYYVKDDLIEAYTITVAEDSYSNLLKIAIENLINKSLISNKPTLLNIYFSNSSIYFQFNTKDLNPILKEAIQKTTFELLDISDIKFI